MPTATALRAELDQTISLARAAFAAGDNSTGDKLVLKAEALNDDYRTARRDDAIRHIGGVHMTSEGPDLAGELLRAGYDRVAQSRVTVDQSFALGLHLKSASVDGGVDGTEIVDEYVAPTLGLDTRYLYPNLRTQGVNSDETGVRSYRQKSRSFASTSSMIRDIDETSAKPETNTVSEVVHAPLKQIAHVSTGTPNVLLANPAFRGWVNTDMVLGYRNAVDAHVVTEIQAAGIPGGGGGANAFEDVLYTQEVIRSAGYQPTIVVVSPGDALAIQLLQLTNGDSYVFAQPAPAFVVSPAVGDGEGFVADASALGILFLSPFSLQTFEEEADGPTQARCEPSPTACSSCSDLMRRQP